MVDPRRDVDDYLRLARENDLSIVYVLETHRQEDFEFGSRTLAQMTGARIVSGSHALFGATDVLGMRLGVFLAVFAPLLVLGLVVVTQLAP